MGWWGRERRAERGGRCHLTQAEMPLSVEGNLVLSLEGFEDTCVSSHPPPPLRKKCRCSNFFYFQWGNCVHRLFNDDVDSIVYARKSQGFERHISFP